MIIAYRMIVVLAHPSITKTVASFQQIVGGSQ